MWGSTTSLATLGRVAGRPDNARRPAAGERRHVRTRPPRVRTLIVDDSEPVRDGLSMLLEAQPVLRAHRRGGRPRRRRSSSRARRHPARGPPGLLDAGRRRRRARPRRSPACRPRPRSSCSARSPTPRRRARPIEAGAIGWVLKDSEPDDLFAALLGAAGGATRRRPRPARSSPDPARLRRRARRPHRLGAAARPRGRPRRDDGREPRRRAR